MKGKLFYVGVGPDYSAFIFPSDVKPNRTTHPGYLFIYGPLRSAEQAKKIAMYHDYNPIFCSVVPA